MWRQEDELQAMLRESADRYAAANETRARFRTLRKSADGFDPERWRHMAELGWTGVLLPEESGGAGLALAQALMLAEAAGRHLIPEPIVASAIIAASVLAAAQAPVATALARGMANGSGVVVLADQELTGTAGPAMLQTRLDRQADGGLVLRGRKVFVPAWTADPQLLVTAWLDGEATVVAVDPAAAGLMANRLTMTDGTACAHLSFDGVLLGGEAIVLHGRAATDAIALATARGTLALAAQLEGAARQLLSMTADYLIQRTQFDKPLASFQSIRHGLVTQHLQIEFAGASWRSAAAALEDGVSVGALIQISAAKARCADAALAMGKAAIHYHGAFGFTEEADIGLYVNAILRWASWLGNAETHRQRALQLSREGRPACK